MKFPPKKYTKAERFITRNWQIIFVSAFLLTCLYFAFFHDDPIDYYPMWDERTR